MRHLLNGGGALCNGDKLCSAGTLDGGAGGTWPIADCPDCIELRGKQLIEQAQQLRFEQMPPLAVNDGIIAARLAALAAQRKPIPPLTEEAKARRERQRREVHVGKFVDGQPGALCGTKEPKYLTGWPMDILSSNGPAGCPACLGLLTPADWNSERRPK